MGAGGRPSKPTHLKAMQGTLRKDRTPSNEPKPTEFKELPNAPPYFDSVAKKEWQRLGPDLVRLGLLTIADLSMFEALCLCYSRIIQAQKVLKKCKSLTYEYTNKADAKNIMVRPEVQIIQKESIILKALASEFGCTPSARSRMNAPDIIPAGGLSGQTGKGGFSEYLGGQRKRDLSGS
jgi:P27 family predicted phage terminase small subunit